MMDNNRAAILKSPQASVAIQQIDTWVPGPGEVLVRNEAIAFNPIEAKIQRYELFKLTYPTILGYTFGGTILSIGPDIASFKPGDRVAVCRWGRAASDDKFGAFQKYPLALEENMVKLDDGTSFETGSGVMANLATVVSALSICMGLDFPPISGDGKARPKSKGQRILVYGGSSSVGALAVRYAKEAGYEVVTTSSLSNWEMVKSRGPNYIIDHKMSKERILEELKLKGPYDGVFDAIGSAEVTTLLGEYLGGNGGGVFFSTSPTSADSELPGNVKKRFESYSDILVSREENRDARNWYLHEYLPKGLADGTIISNPALVVPGGLDSVQNVLDTFIAGKVSGKKVFVNPQE